MLCSIMFGEFFRIFGLSEVKNVDYITQVLRNIQKELGLEKVLKKPPPIVECWMEKSYEKLRPDQICN